uniref:ATP synthase F0 subunit 8 n=1 Tax=Pisidia serratifrons TaxID=761937 RepID=UPI00226D2B4B|nr:ATP synthase F0 subunit 8 [Pisidia serratifrons]UZA47094.1 ATP synthase F0 subunit 8 [Pisidia serratifrons]
MPQAAPIYWLFMLVFFSISFLFFIILNYFMKSSEKMNLKKNLFSTSKKNWKW